MVIKIRLDDAADEYEKHCLSRGLTEGTARSRRASLAVFSRVTSNPLVDKISHQDIDRVFATCQWQASTRNNRMGQYKAFFEWCRTRKYMAVNSDPMFGWRGVTVPTKRRTRIPRSEWDTLFNACVHEQERIVLATGLYLFLRASEQMEIQLKHVNLQAGEIEIHRRKTKDWDVMPITAELDVHIRAHMTWLAKHGASDPEHFLIPAREKDLDLDENGRWIAGTGSFNPERPFSKPHRVVQRILKRTGYYTHGEGEHTLRRSGARAYFDALVDQGYDGALRRVQSMLGHKHSHMTEVYLGLDLDRQRRNQDLRGKHMFEPIQDAKILPIRRDHNG